MKKALILYWHGLGDIILLTPHLRYLYNEGYIVDLMCMPQTRKSHLLDDCPYVNKLIDVPNVWKSPLGFDGQVRKNVEYFEHLRKHYDWSGKSCHIGIGGTNKIDFTSMELGLDIPDRKLEVFIPNDVEEYVLDYINTKYKNGYIFIHTYIYEHQYHDWDASDWIKTNLPNLPIIDTGYKGEYYLWHENINATFVLLREARHRVLSSSVMVHACDAMNAPIDIVNYGRPDRKVWPDNENLIQHIREKGKFIK